MDFIFILGRLLLGGYFVMSGSNHFRHTPMLAGYAASKGIPSAKAGVLVSGLMMVLGGLGIIFNTYVEISTLLLIVFLLAASFGIHNFWKVTDPQARMPEFINFSKNIALIGALLMLMRLLGSWTF